MQPTIKFLPAKKLIGHRIRMSLAENKTAELWRAFMLRRKEILNNITTDLFSLQVHDEFADPSQFRLNALFDKWAAVEVTNFDNVPVAMETYVLPSGLYAVFIHIGAASAGATTFQRIFETWLPTSHYALDNRPHFEILGKKYKNNDPDSEEEIWIPIKVKE